MTSVLGMREFDALRFLSKENTGFLFNVKAVNQNFYL
jgi:hypothetical protein